MTDDPKQSALDALRYQTYVDTTLRPAERAHDTHIQHGRDMNAASVSTAQLALRTVVLVNGGSAAAMLAFLGALVGKGDPPSLILVQRIAGSLLWFASGLVVATFAMLLAFAAIYCGVEAIRGASLSYKHPYVDEKTPSAEFWGQTEAGFMVAAATAAFFSLGLCAIGFVSVYRAFP